jgi:hypothetical protein
MPLLPANPVAKIVPTVRRAAGEFQLECSWEAVESNDTLEYNVEWFIDNQIVDMDTILGAEDQEMKAFMNTSLLSGLQYGSKVSSWPFSSV